MSTAARQALVNHPHLFFQNRESQVADLLRVGQSGVPQTGTQTQLIAFLTEMLMKGYILETTMIQTGHHDDGVRGHWGGYGWDGWLLNSPTEGDWMDASNTKFEQFLYDAAKSVWRYQIGMVGDGSDSADNFHYAIKGAQDSSQGYVADVSVFQDSGGAHIHLGAQGDW